MDQWTSPEGQPRTGVKIYQSMYYCGQKFSRVRVTRHKLTNTLSFWIAALEVVKKGQQAENQEGQDGQAEGYAQ